MINNPGRGLVCVFGGESWPDEVFLYICDQCGHAVCSDHSEWVKVDSQEKNGFTQPVASSRGWHVRVCLRCINPGLTIQEWNNMDEFEQNGLGKDGGIWKTPLETYGLYPRTLEVNDA